MASFLTLCEDLATESGVIGRPPSAVTGQAGRQAKAVRWIRTAWLLIQNSNPDWTFLLAEWSHALTIGQTTYTALQMGIAARFGEWRGDRLIGRRLYRPTTIYDPALGQADESELEEIDFELWKTSYDRGAQISNRPVRYCFAPDGTVRFGPKPDKAYTVRGEYRKAPQDLAANGDIPDMPLRFHDLIVYRAIMLIAEHDESPNGLAGATTKFREMLFDLQRDCLPEVTTTGDGPLA